MSKVFFKLPISSVFGQKEGRLNDRKIDFSSLDIRYTHDTGNPSFTVKHL